METVIIICLLIIIVLLAQDKIVIKEKLNQKSKQEKINVNLPDIMGQSKAARSLLAPKTVIESQIAEPEINSDTLDIQYDKNETLGIEIPKEELDEVFSSIPDWEEEEEEWNRYGIYGGDDCFAQGVTFEELSSVGMLLQMDKLESSQKETAAALVQKIQGTELFSLLENSIESASRKIAELLDGRLSNETDADSSILRKKDFNDFDIGEFV